MEPVKSRGSKDRIDKRKVPDGDGNYDLEEYITKSYNIDKRKVPDGDGNIMLNNDNPSLLNIDKRKVPDGDGNTTNHCSCIPIT